MKEPDERFRQLGLFSVIVAEIVIIPGALAGLAYFLTHHSDPLGISWKVWTGLGGATGFVAAFYRIFKMGKN